MEGSNGVIFQEREEERQIITHVDLYARILYVYMYACMYGTQHWWYLAK